MQTTPSSKRIQFTPEARGIMANIAAADHPPGTIVDDFSMLLDFIGDTGIAVSPKTSEFPLTVLPQINARLKEPAAVGLPRGKQVSYPHVHALHQLLRFSEMALIQNDGKAQSLRCHPVVRAQWQALNPIERYFALLEVWWIHSTGDSGGFRNLRLDRVRGRAQVLHSLGTSGKVFTRRQADEICRYQFVGAEQVALMQMFGLLEVEQVEAEPGKGWSFRALRPSPWGRVACESFAASFVSAPETDTNTSLADLNLQALLIRSRASGLRDEASVFSDWAKQVASSFPTWKNRLARLQSSDDEIDCSGEVELKVSLNASLWRRLVLPRAAYFSDLADLILDAFQFDDDHLFTFHVKDPYGKRQLIDDPRSDFGLGDPADTVHLATLIRAPRQLLEFHFDDWRFSVVVERIDPKAKARKGTILERQGAAPAQYG